MAVVADALRTHTRARILEAAFRAVSTFGLSRFTMDDVARSAAVSRQTVYRYFPSRDDLILALVEREEETFLEGTRAAFSAHRRLEDAMEQALLFSLRAAREHPLLDRLLAAEPEALLPYLTIRGGPLLARARAVLEELVRGRTDVRPELLHRAVDLAVRAVVSYTLTPTEDLPEDVARESARILTSALNANRKEDRR
ncbi:MAG TPA: TetR family transcriptional regulator [Actinomycetota bacterium]|nr:TetR family transcriptional regulator [Actinomycetota bacterium]